MTKTKSSTLPPCGCQNCLCHRGPRCRCHSYNALLALAIWDYRREILRRKNSA
jgi:hypothetical protein